MNNVCQETVSEVKQPPPIIIELSCTARLVAYDYATERAMPNSAWHGSGFK